MRPPIGLLGLLLLSLFDDYIYYFTFLTHCLLLYTFPPCFKSMSVSIIMLVKVSFPIGARVVGRRYVVVDVLNSGS